MLDIEYEVLTGHGTFVSVLPLPAWSVTSRFYLAHFYFSR